MRFSARSKVGIILSILTILTLVSAFMVMVISSHGSGAHAASRSAGPVFHGTLHKSTRRFSAKSLKTGAIPKLTRQQASSRPHAKHAFSLGGVPAKGITPKALKGQAATASYSLGLLSAHTAEGDTLQNFDGLSDLDSNALNGFSVTPPDQGLCVGVDPFVTGSPLDPSGHVEFEMVNLAVAEFGPDGTFLGASSLAGFFLDPNFLSDPRCVWDASTKTFFFTVLTTDFANFSGVDVVVFNTVTASAAEYFFGTDLGLNLLGDQPLLGLDNNAVYLSTNEFAGFGSGNFVGSLIIGISKAHLVNETFVAFSVDFFVTNVNGVPAFSIQPGDTVSTGANTEYLLESFPYLDGAGTPNPTDKTLALWSVTGDVNITSGNFAAVVLSEKNLGSERYAFPVAAASTGSGVTDAFGITSEAFLNPDDDRMQQVEVIRDTVTGHLDLWASLSSAVNFAGDPNTYDGVAWFKIDARVGSILQQGFVASQGRYLLYPAIEHTIEGSTTIGFSITSPSLVPSAAYTVRKSGTTLFGGIHIAALGADSHESFSDFFFNQARWGDYSAAALDVNGKDIWMATEYIPVQARQDPGDNWGTRIFESMGDH